MENRIEELEERIDALEDRLEAMDEKMLTWGRLTTAIIGGFIGIVIVKFIFKLLGW